MGIEVGLKPIPTGEYAEGNNWWLYNKDMRDYGGIGDPVIGGLLITDVPNVPWMSIDDIIIGLNRYKPDKAVICIDKKINLEYPYIHFTHDDYRRYPLYFSCSNIFLHTDEEDLVFDPFCGYSTTGIAALDMHRRYLGIEINPEIYRISLGNLESVEKKTFIWQ